MNKNCCCVIFVTHKSSLDGYELKSFQQCLDVFGKKRDIKLVIPDNISTEFYDKYSDKFEYCKVNYEWLSSYKAYNKTCCTKEFYELFKDYEYILKYEADAWVFEDRLDEFMELGYDYYGAAWPHLQDKVGNGGFSLRKINKMIELTNKYKYNEDSIESHCDTWFCVTHGNELNICDLETACNFSIESMKSTYFKKVKNIPMGFHGKLMRSKCWDDDGTKFLEIKKAFN